MSWSSFISLADSGCLKGRGKNSKKESDVYSLETHPRGNSTTLNRELVCCVRLFRHHLRYVIFTKNEYSESYTSAVMWLTATVLTCKIIFVMDKHHIWDWWYNLNGIKNSLSLSIDWRSQSLTTQRYHMVQTLLFCWLTSLWSSES